MDSVVRKKYQENHKGTAGLLYVGCQRIPVKIEDLTKTDLNVSGVALKKGMKVNVECAGKRLKGKVIRSDWSSSDIRLI